MRIKREDAIAQIDAALSAPDWNARATNVPHPRRAALSASAIATVQRLTPAGSAYRHIADQELLGDISRPTTMSRLSGVLRSLRADFEAGYADSVEELVHADVFGDFIEMAQELLDKDYKDAAAVIAGTVLEGHLRQLGGKHGVDVLDDAGKPKKADRLNADLTKASAYGGLDQKQVTAWLGLRNDAAHGHYDRYEAPQVALMIQGVTDFLIRLPA